MYNTFFTLNALLDNLVEIVLELITISKEESKQQQNADRNNNQDKRATQNDQIFINDSLDEYDDDSEYDDEEEDDATEHFEDLINKFDELHLLSILESLMLLEKEDYIEKQIHKIEKQFSEVVIFLAKRIDLSKKSKRLPISVEHLEIVADLFDGYFNTIYNFFKSYLSEPCKLYSFYDLVNEYNTSRNSELSASNFITFKTQTAVDLSQEEKGFLNELNEQTNDIFICNSKTLYTLALYKRTLSKLEKVEFVGSKKAAEGFRLGVTLKLERNKMAEAFNFEKDGGITKNTKLDMSNSVFLGIAAKLRRTKYSKLESNYINLEIIDKYGLEHAE